MRHILLKKKVVHFVEKICEHTCHRCGSEIIPEEINDSSFCGYCSYTMSKDD